MPRPKEREAYNAFMREYMVVRYNKNRTDAIIYHEKINVAVNIEDVKKAINDYSKYKKHNWTLIWIEGDCYNAVLLAP